MRRSGGRERCRRVCEDYINFVGQRSMHFAGTIRHSKGKIDELSHNDNRNNDLKKQ